MRLLLALAAMMLGVQLQAGPVRIALLTDSYALQDTLDLLKENGCHAESVAAFRRVVERYNSTPGPDFGKFPRARGGFHGFESPTQLVAALPHKLYETRHAYEFNCFDTLLLLTDGQFRTSKRAGEIQGTILSLRTLPQGTQVVPTATVGSAFTNAYPDWYRQATRDAVPKRLAEFRPVLTTGLFRCLELPANTDERQLDKIVLKILQDGWKQMGLVFPTKVQVVLCNQVNVPKRILVSVHAGVLFSRQRGFTYLEKAGGSGPFVRLDLQAKEDLVPWLSAIFAGAERQGFTDHFVTFNDSSIMRSELEER
jgi:hypothetical protein